MCQVRVWRGHTGNKWWNGAEGISTEETALAERLRKYSPGHVWKFEKNLSVLMGRAAHEGEMEI